MLIILCQNRLDYCTRYGSRATSWGHFRFIVGGLSDENLETCVAIIMIARKSVQCFALLEVVSAADARAIMFSFISSLTCGYLLHFLLISLVPSYPESVLDPILDTNIRSLCGYRE